jgi:nucleoside-diphosphate-sugar epimerase/predicted dehydrogenase
MTKIGMLGAGYILASHARSVAAISGLELCVIGDASAGRAAKAAHDFGFGQHVNSIEAMAASDCDIVHILLPPNLHELAARQMMEAGKSVFVEKPFVLTAKAARNLARLAENRNARIGVNHNFLFGRNYQPLRDLVRGGGLGRIDSLSVDWQLQLPFLKHGPFDNWIVSGPANPLFEIAPHPLAFALDLLSAIEIVDVKADDMLQLPSGIAVPQRWQVLASSAQGAVSISLSLTSGHESRTLSLRGEGGAARYDFGRDIAVVERTRSDNPMLDTFRIASDAAKSIKAQAGPDLRRRVRAALSKHPASSPFEESVYNSIAAFYAQLDNAGDVRHGPAIGTDIATLSETIAKTAGYDGATAKPLNITMPRPDRKSTVLVIGGTGFIGRALVKRLIAEGKGVRILSRSGRSAALALSGMPVEIMTGHYGDEAALTPALKGIEVVYHLAKCEGRRWQEYLDGDVAPTRTLGTLAAAAGVRRFIYTGTIDSYDSASPATVIDNMTPVDRRISGRNLYARSKAACEAVLSSLAQDAGLNLVIIRPGIVIGSGSPPAHLGVGRFSGDTQVEYWGDGHNKLPFVHVDDVADALVRASTVPGIEGRSFLVSGPPIFSARDYVAALEHYSGSRISARDGSPIRFWLADFIKEAAKNLIGHPNRRRSTLHDWQCRTHQAKYDASQTEKILGWQPIDDASALRDRGVAEAIASK